MTVRHVRAEGILRRDTRVVSSRARHANPRRSELRGASLSLDAVKFVMLEAGETGTEPNRTVVTRDRATSSETVRHISRRVGKRVEGIESPTRLIARLPRARPCRSSRRRPATAASRRAARRAPTGTRRRSARASCGPTRPQSRRSRARLGRPDANQQRTRGTSGLTKTTPRVTVPRSDDKCAARAPRSSGACAAASCAGQIRQARRARGAGGGRFVGKSARVAMRGGVSCDPDMRLDWQRASDGRRRAWHASISSRQPPPARATAAPTRSSGAS